jgi:hypothetical protein
MSKFQIVSKILECGNVASAINAYETLPTRVSPRTLITSWQDTDEDKYESGEEYPFETLNTLKKKLSGHKEEK